MFENRADAGRKLAERLRGLEVKHPAVLALPRGGVPVGFEIARALRAPLDVLLVRKIGVPGDEEFALGAVAEGTPPEIVIDTGLLERLDISDAELARVRVQALRELERRRAAYRGSRPALDPAGRSVIVVDDGIATGYTMLAALRALRRQGPARVILAAPVAPPDALARLSRLADETVCLVRRQDMGAVGRFYQAFPQLEDAEVIALLEAARETADRARNP